MKINRNKFINYLKKNHLDITKFVKTLDWDLDRFIKMLFGNGNLNREESEHFLQIVGAEDALEIINWRAMNVARPKYRAIFQPSYAN